MIGKGGFTFGHVWIVPERPEYGDIVDHVLAGGVVVQRPRVLTSAEFVEGL